ncbi:hypothetical protein [Aeropyrum camini]|uniref:hypothetical protein n=1 Tax=Aeropyrum camini TaxID=229980 RepID=UPI000787E22D|nr:hypothetical protein [Aeropyrum camini]
MRVKSDAACTASARRARANDASLLTSLSGVDAASRSGGIGVQDLGLLVKGISPPLTRECRSACGAITPIIIACPASTISRSPAMNRIVAIAASVAIWTESR